MERESAEFKTSDFTGLLIAMAMRGYPQVELISFPAGDDLESVAKREEAEIKLQELKAGQPADSVVQYDAPEGTPGIPEGQAATHKLVFIRA